MLPTKLVIVDDSPSLEVTTKKVQLLVKDERPVFKVTGTDKVLKVEPKQTQLVHVGFQGPVGPAGTDASPGSGGDLTYVHVQFSASALWNIQHDLGKHPSVTIVDSADTVVVGDVSYIDSDNLTVAFSSGFAGKAYLN